MKGSTIMRKEIFDEFPALWDEFESNIKRVYIEVITTTPLTCLTPTNRFISSVYWNCGFSHWNVWRYRLEEFYFESVYWKFWNLLERYDELNELVYNSVKSIPALSEEMKNPEMYAIKDEKEVVEAFYNATLKPHMDTRKQEIINEICKMKEELDQPVSYELELRMDDKKQRILLKFKTRYKKKHRDIELYKDTGLSGYRYVFNGRSYEDYHSLTVEKVEKLSEYVSIYKDAYGDKVLRIYEEIPTFDAGDREWDSEIMRYLFFDGKEIHMMIMRAGYKIQYLAFYETLVYAESGMEPFFEKLGWPVGKIPNGNNCEGSVFL